MQNTPTNQCIDATTMRAPALLIVNRQLPTQDPDDELDALLEEAAAADPGSRIEYRDRIASYGAAGIQGIAPWLNDARLGAFAVRVAERAATYDARDEAIRALKSAVQQAVSQAVVADATDALHRLAPTSARQRSISAPRRRERDQANVMAPDDLVRGKVYRRRELHLDGLGGNWQSGISYPADGTYVLLFSDPEAGREHGYVDRWSGDEYLYYGQWTGTGDMVFEVGNRAVMGRAEELHLFVAASGGHRYEGRFRLSRHETASTVRDGRQWQAIVFVLERHGT